MGLNTGIEWATHTWNPWYGCKKVSAGCKFCYMYRDVKRWGKDPATVTRANDNTFFAPLKWWKRGKSMTAEEKGAWLKNGKQKNWLEAGDTIFVCSWSDWCIEEADEWRKDSLAVMRSLPEVIFIVVTKRPERLPGCLPADWNGGWRNVWMLVSAEDQERMDERVPLLLDVPAAVRGVSVEPLLERVWMSKYLSTGKVHWVIGGGESVSKRVCELDWLRVLRDDCEQFGVAFFLKQIGGNKKIDGAWGGDRLDGKRWRGMPGSGV